MLGIQEVVSTVLYFLLIYYMSARIYTYYTHKKIREDANTNISKFILV
jgi:hypothetical protein